MLGCRHSAGQHGVVDGQYAGSGGVSVGTARQPGAVHHRPGLWRAGGGAAQAHARPLPGGAGPPDCHSPGAAGLRHEPPAACHRVSPRPFHRAVRLRPYRRTARASRPSSTPPCAGWKRCCAAPRDGRYEHARGRGDCARGAAGAAQAGGAAPASVCPRRSLVRGPQPGIGLARHGGGGPGGGFCAAWLDHARRRGPPCHRAGRPGFAGARKRGRLCRPAPADAAGHDHRRRRDPQRARQHGRVAAGAAECARPGQWPSSSRPAKDCGAISPWRN